MIFGSSGDNFLQDVYPALNNMIYQAQRNKELIPPYIDEFYNIQCFENKKVGTYAIGRLINSLIEAINLQRRLQKYLLVIIDKDVINDIDDLTQPAADTITRELVQWTVRQINTAVCRRLDLLEKKPGAVMDQATKIIYIRMIKRIGSFNENSRIHSLCEFRAKFNNALNDAVAKTGQYMLTINSCNQYQHFDRHGNLSQVGKELFGHEIDDLIDRFDADKVKLLPNPKNQPKTTTWKSRRAEEQITSVTITVGDYQLHQSKDHTVILTTEESTITTIKDSFSIYVPVSLLVCNIQHCFLPQKFWGKVHYNYSIKTVCKTF